jgi:hypothetical protein
LYLNNQSTFSSDDFVESDIPVSAPPEAAANGGGVSIDLSGVERRLERNEEALNRLADAMTRQAVAMERLVALKQAKYELTNKK